MFAYALISGAYSSHRDALRMGEIRAKNIATSLATQMSLSFRAADLVTQVVNRIAVSSDFSNDDLPILLEHLLQTNAALYPEVETLSLVDENGKITYSWPEKIESRQARSIRLAPQFNTPGTDTALAISSPVTHLRAEKWIVPVTRKIEGGVKSAAFVQVGVSVDHLSTLFNQIDIGRDGIILLETKDRIALLVRPNSLTSTEKSVFEHLEPVADDLDTGLLSSRIVESPDGFKRLNYRVSVDGYPLVINVALGYDEVLKEWTQSFSLQLMITALAALLIGMLTTYLLHILKTREFIEAEVEAKNRALVALAEELKAQVMLDGMTGLANRHQLDTQLRSEIARLSRSKSSLSLVLFDVDRFKQYNDRYGHVEGDHCLQKISQILKSAQRRQGDLAARYGGEEFVLMLPCTDETYARKVAQKVLEDLRALKIPHEGSPSRFVTISAGVMSCVPTRQTHLDEIYAAADKALYEAKSHGRDCIEIWSPQMSEEEEKLENA